MKTAAAVGFLGLILAGVTVSSDSAKQSAANPKRDVRAFAYGVTSEPITQTTSIPSARKRDLQLTDGASRDMVSLEERFEPGRLADRAWEDATLLPLPAPGEETAAPYVGSNGKAPKRNSLLQAAIRLDYLSRTRSDISITVPASPIDELPKDRNADSSTRSHGEPSGLPSTSENADLKSGVPSQYLALVERCANETAVEERWMLAILHAENAAFNPKIVSPAGAIGLMQVKPLVGKHYGAADLTDPQQNICAAARFLKDLFAKYGNPVMVVAAYNAGEPRIDERASLPLIRETVDYVSRVTSYYYTGAANDARLKQRNVRIASWPSARGALTTVNESQLAAPLSTEFTASMRTVGQMSQAERIRTTSVVMNVVE